jgi:sugar phosphate isomerase/epimerase
MRIALGCLSRPWHEHTLEEALQGIAAAGFGVVGLLTHQGKPAFTADSSDEEIARLKESLLRHNLKLQVAIRQPNLWEMKEAEAAALFRREIERGRALGLEYFILTGISDESKYQAWYSAVAQCLDCAREHGVMLLLKPHGGLCARADDLLRAVERFRHPNFGICYDPGNIYYYTGEKAEEDLPKIVEHVRGMCIKDEIGGKEGEVMITPGTGVVDFPRIFTILNGAGFAGPCWVECLGGSTLDEVNAEAKRTYRFISDVVAAI